MSEQLLSTGQAAAVLQLSRTRVQQLVRAGTIPAERLPVLNSWVRIRRDDLEAFAAANHVTLDWSRLPA